MVVLGKNWDLRMADMQRSIRSPIVQNDRLPFSRVTSLSIDRPAPQSTKSPSSGLWNPPNATRQQNDGTKVVISLQIPIGVRSQSKTKTESCENPHRMEHLSQMPSRILNARVQNVEGFCEPVAFLKMLKLRKRRLH
jgi:hypothetical protein